MREIPHRLAWAEWEIGNYVPSGPRFVDTEFPRLKSKIGVDTTHPDSTSLRTNLPYKIKN